LSVITPSNKPAKKPKTIKEMKQQVVASNTPTILSIKDLVKEKKVFSKEEG
jgi:predicted transcriptional regulator